MVRGNQSKCVIALKKIIELSRYDRFGLISMLKAEQNRRSLTLILYLVVIVNDEVKVSWACVFVLIAGEANRH
jgi:hypothetical protein